MANRYYLCDVSVQRNSRINSARQRFSGNSLFARDLAHWRESLNGDLIIVQGEITDVDHDWMISNAWVTFLGFNTPPNIADQSVFDYIAANASLWISPGA